MRWYAWRLWRIAWSPENADGYPVIDARGRWRPVCGPLFWLGERRTP